MPEDRQSPAGEYKINKRFRCEENVPLRKQFPFHKKVIDLDRNAFFGRTAWQWTRVTLYYIFLYSLIAIICLFWLTIFYWLIIDKEIPSIKKDQPGVSVIPRSSKTFHTNIIQDIYVFADAIDDALANLEGDSTVFAAFNKDKLWGYNEQKPCVFIKLNNIYGFTAETYDTKEELPSHIPDLIEQYIKNYPGKGKIWLTCEGKASTTVIIRFIPGPYYDTKTDMKGMNRLVAVQFSNLPENESVCIKCKVWAKNININQEYNGRGHVKFSIHMIVKY